MWRSVSVDISETLFTEFLLKSVLGYPVIYLKIRLSEAENASHLYLINVSVHQRSVLAPDHISFESAKFQRQFSGSLFVGYDEHCFNEHGNLPIS